jgi:Holliday junction resolvase RusA-like endonuclease
MEQVKLDLPPALNSVYRSAHINGHIVTYKSKEAKVYTEYVKLLMCRIKPTEKNVHLHLEFYFRRDRDIDSSLKVLLDCFSGCIYNDDKQITRLDVWKYKLDKNSSIRPCVVVKYKLEESIDNDVPF